MAIDMLHTVDMRAKSALSKFRITAHVHPHSIAGCCISAGSMLFSVPIWALLVDVVSLRTVCESYHEA